MDTGCPGRSGTGECLARVETGSVQEMDKLAPDWPPSSAETPLHSSLCSLIGILPLWSGRLWGEREREAGQTDPQKKSRVHRSVVCKAPWSVQPANRAGAEPEGRGVSG